MVFAQADRGGRREEDNGSILLRKMVFVPFAFSVGGWFCGGACLLYCTVICSARGDHCSLTIDQIYNPVKQEEGLKF